MVGASTRRRVRINEKTVENTSNTDSPEKKKKKSLLQRKPHWPEFLEWIPNNWTWSNIKPVIRSALAGWIALVLFVIPKVQNFFGNAGYLILVAAFLLPPSDSFIATFEREALSLFFLALAWAWACLGMKLSNLARTNTTQNPNPTEVFSGQFIETGPAVILSIFVFLGACFFLYIKARQGPGPYMSASILGCIFIDIAMLTANLFPFPFYLVARSVALPLAFHSALTLLSALLLFPTTVSCQFTTRMGAVIDPLLSSFSHHRTLLSLNPCQDKETFQETLGALQTAIKQSEGALLPLAASARLLPSDIIICRFSPADFKALQESIRRLAVRANGLTVYYTVVDPNKEKFPTTPVPSHPGTPSSNRSRNPSPDRYQQKREEETDGMPMQDRGRNRGRDSQASISRSPTPTKRFGHPHPQPHHSHSLLHTSLLHLSMSKHSLKPTYPVGVFESQKYLNLDSADQEREDNESRNRNTGRASELLKRSCLTMLDESEKGLKVTREWFDTVRRGRLATIFSTSGEKERKRRQDLLDKLQEIKEQLDEAIRKFKDDERHAILEPYLSTSSANEEDTTHDAPPPHRYLFYCYVYQYHLLQFILRISCLLDQIITLEKDRKRLKLWGPAREWFTYHKWQAAEDLEQTDDEDPDMIKGMEPEWVEDLGEPHRRDPDALPPKNVFEWVMHRLWVGVTALGRGNTLFAIKAGIFTILLSLPSLIRSSAGFAYANRFYWGIFMGQLTLARFRGDTMFGLVSRITATFSGGIAGLVLWYISTGTAYGIAIVGGVCFPFFFYIRLYWPGPQMTNMIFFVTIALVLGFSYQDKVFHLPGSVGTGFEVAWRRFVLVAAGVTAAFLVSFLPPSTTIRAYQRVALSTTLSELGSILCSITGYAIVRNEATVPEIVSSLIAVRSKLNRSIMAKQNALYEISLRGRWPAERYQKVLKLQITLSYQLSHLLSVIVNLEPAWAQALLRRTRLQDSTFQGELLAVIAMMSTSLRHGIPLPQITPCPLLERFKSRFHGLDVIHKDSEEDYGLPRLLTRETLENEQYLMFCVGVATTFGIMTSLDRLMMAIKELVGEQYHIHGAGLEWAKSAIPGGSRVDSASASIDLSQKV